MSGPALRRDTNPMCSAEAVMSKDLMVCYWHIYTCPEYAPGTGLGEMRSRLSDGCVVSGGCVALVTCLCFSPRPAAASVAAKVASITLKHRFADGSLNHK